jgi:MFS family permease
VGTASSPRRFAAWPMVVLALVNLVDQVDVSILRGVLPILEDEWALSDLELGLLGFVFIFVNALATVPAGWLADHTRRTGLMGWTLLSWSGLILLSATAVNYGNLLAARAVMGIGQAVDDPASTSLLGDYYPSRLRARAFSLQQVSLFVGGGLGLALGGLVGETLGWRWAFALVGMPGSVVALLAFRLREPRRGEADRPEGVDAEQGPDVTSLAEFLRRVRVELGAELRVIFGIRTMRYILVGVAALLFTVSGIGYWLAVYHDRYSDMSLGEATAYTALVLAVGGGIGTFAGGALSDRLHGRVSGGRILLVVWSSIACALLFLLSFAVPSIAVRLALQFLGVMAAAGAVPGLRAAMLDVVPAASRGVGASAFALTAAIFGTALAPPLVGLLSDLTSLVGAFYIVFPPVIVGLLFLLRARSTVDADAAALLAALVPEEGG